MDATQIIRALGGPSKLAATLGLPANTVAYWGHRNKIPADRGLEVWRLALAANLAWEPPGAEGLRDLLCHLPACPTAEDDVTQVEARLAEFHASPEADLACVSERLTKFHGEGAKPSEAA